VGSSEFEGAATVIGVVMAGDAGIADTMAESLSSGYLSKPAVGRMGIGISKFPPRQTSTAAFGSSKRSAVINFVAETGVGRSMVVHVQNGRLAHCWH
jgi:hypothetical protein